MKRKREKISLGSRAALLELASIIPVVFEKHGIVGHEVGHILINYSAMVLYEMCFTRTSALSAIEKIINETYDLIENTN